MKIIGKLLINCFYEKDGWSREEVVKLIKNKSEFANILRKIECKENEDGEKFYTVYDNHVIFDRKKVEEHEYISMIKDGKFCEDNDFFKKNNCN